MPDRSVLEAEECWISVDVESSGPVPGLYSLLSIGACVIDQPDTRFYRELQPLPDASYVPEAVQVGWPDQEPATTMQQLAEAGVAPNEAMHQFDGWVKHVAAGRRPVFVGFNATFDWMFTHYYFEAARIPDPFGHAGLDIKSYWAGKVGCSWKDTSRQRLPESVNHGLGGLSHRADEDAYDQAIVLQRMREA